MELVQRVSCKPHRLVFLLVGAAAQHAVHVDSSADVFDSSVEHQLAPNDTVDFVSLRGLAPTWADRLDHGSFRGFPSYEQAYELLDQWLAKYPSLLRRTEIGASYENRPIHAYQLTSRADLTDDRPQVLLTSLMHSREPASLTVVLYFIGHLLELHEQGDTEAAYIVKNRDIWIIPFVNPDGYVANKKSDERHRRPEIRKNRRPTCKKSPAHGGVDINRNFPLEWKAGMFPECGEEYQGTKPFSEPETQALKKICDEHNFKAAMNFHTFGSMLTHPYNYAPTVQKSKLPKADDNTIYREIAAEFKFDKFGPAISTVGYTAPGESDDWFYDAKGIIAMSPEVGPESGDFYPPARHIAGIDSRNFERTLYLVKKTGLELGASIKLKDQNLRGSSPSSTWELTVSNAGLSASGGKQLGIAMEITLGSELSSQDRTSVTVTVKDGEAVPVEYSIAAKTISVRMHVAPLPRRSSKALTLSVVGWQLSGAQVRMCGLELGRSNVCQCLGPSVVPTKGGTSILKSGSWLSTEPTSADIKYNLCRAAATFSGRSHANAKTAPVDPAAVQIPAETTTPLPIPAQPLSPAPPVPPAPPAPPVVASVQLASLDTTTLATSSPQELEHAAVGTQPVPAGSDEMAGHDAEVNRSTNNAPAPVIRLVILGITAAIVPAFMGYKLVTMLRRRWTAREFENKPRPATDAELEPALDDERINVPSIVGSREHRPLE